jgi:hypothetical protein
MKTYFKICLLSPIWFPLMLIGLLLSIESILELQSDALKWLCIYFGASLLVGGVQYLIAMILVWRRIDFGSFESIVRGCLVLPIVFTPIQLICVSFLMVGDGLGALDALFGLAAVNLLYGYAYVLVWFFVYWLFTLFQKIRGEVHYG